MTRISVELVPRSSDSLLAELKELRENFASITTINIPDLTRFPLRSWEGCRISAQFYPHTIPHLRAIDIPKEVPLAEGMSPEQCPLKEVLVIAGDPPQDLTKKVYSTSSIDLIKKLKREIPGITVYAAIDQYRSSVREEYEYIQRKLDAGADGFFTQPFFDIRLMEIYAELVADSVVFWGVSPVLTEGSKGYWEAKNSVVFPRNFALSMEWNKAFAKEALAFARAQNGNIYFMPIRTDTVAFLKGIID